MKGITANIIWVSAAVFVVALSLAFRVNEPEEFQDDSSVLWLPLFAATMFGAAILSTWALS